MVWAIKETFADIQGCKLGGNNYITRFMDTIFLFSFIVYLSEMIWEYFEWEPFGITAILSVINFHYTVRTVICF